MNNNTAPRTGAVLALLLCLSALGPLPGSASSPTDPCALNEVTLTAPAFIVPKGTTRILNESTTIHAQTVSVLGVLRTRDAQPGQDAPSLCIEAATLDVGGILCTGSGGDGQDRIASGSNQTLKGGDGTSGGTLVLRLQSPPSVASGATICTGNGGMGGSAMSTQRSQFLECSPLIGVQITWQQREQQQPIVPVAKNTVYCLRGNAPDAALPSCRDPALQDKCNKVPVCRGLQASLLALAASLVATMDQLDLPYQNNGAAAMMGLQQTLRAWCGVELPCEQVTNSPDCVPPTHVPTCHELTGHDTCVPQDDPCQTAPAACNPGPACQGLMAYLADLLYHQPSSQDQGAADLAALDVGVNQAVQDCTPHAPTCQQVTGSPDCVPTVPCLMPCVPEVPGGICDSERAPSSAAGGKGGDGGEISLTYLHEPATGTIAPHSLVVGNGGAGGNAFAFGTPYGPKHATGGDGGTSIATVNGATPMNMSWFHSGLGGNGGSATAENANCVTLPCDFQYLVWCSVDIVRQNVCFDTTPPYIGLGSVSNFCQDLENILKQALGLEVPLVGPPGKAASGYTGNAVAGGDGAEGHQGSYGADASLQFGTDGGSASAGCPGASTPGGAGGSGGGGGNGNPGSATGGAGSFGLLRGGDGGHASYQASNGGNGGKGGSGGRADRSICGTVAEAGDGGDGGNGGNSGTGRSQGGEGGDSALAGGKGGDASGTVGTPGAGGTGGNGGASTLECDATGTTCWPSAPGAWGCGGHTGNYGVVHIEGGPGGKNLLVPNESGPLNGPPGMPSPATTGIDLPASTPPQTYNSHGGGSPRNPPCP